ncbi:secreted antigen 1 [Babesia caballi]|uniref:Secreted antigen 1 n=1 Tax=Babesia caballi TaxID=5871 RepID=A0AAV4M2T8_BABCB|nr:secreted antigen 1 [Babesia caballi]
MTSGSESGSCEGRQIEEPRNLKDALDFLAALGNNATLITQVGEKLREKVSLYFNTEKLAGGTYDIKDCLTEVLDAVSTTRRTIVSVTKLPDYGYYSSLHADKDCVDKCVGFLLNLLPILHTTLYYLYFRTDSTLSMRIGGDWKMYKCNEYNEDLCKWFTDANGAGVIADSEAKLLPGGYSGKGELKDTYGHILGGELSLIVDPQAGEGRLPDLLITVFFDTTLTHASAAAALNFVQTFCKAVNKGYFNATMEIPNCLSEICLQILPNIAPLTAGPPGRRFLESLFQGTENDYVEILRPEAYNKYAGWLKDKLPTLISSLDEMKNECDQWNPSSIHQSEVVGPFAYGFMFGRALRRGHVDLYDIRTKIKNAVTTLIAECRSSKKETLVALWQCLNASSSNCSLAPSSVIPTTVIHRAQHEEASSTAVAPTEEKIVGTQRQSTQENHPSPPVSGEQPHVPEPDPATESPSISSSSSGAEPSATTRDTDSGVDRLTEQTTHVTNTSRPNSGSKTLGPSGAISSPSCSSGVSCGDHSHDGASGGSSSSTTRIVNDANVNNTQSTITIGGATGGAAVLGGGCAALYFLNVGGIKTLITGVP